MGKNILTKAFNVGGKRTLMDAENYKTDVTEDKFISGDLGTLLGLTNEAAFFLKRNSRILADHAAVRFPHTAAFLMKIRLEYHCFNLNIPTEILPVITNPAIVFWPDNEHF